MSKLRPGAGVGQIGRFARAPENGIGLCVGVGGVVGGGWGSQRKLFDERWCWGAFPVFMELSVFNLNLHVRPFMVLDSSRSRGMVSEFCCAVLFYDFRKKLFSEF